VKEAYLDVCGKEEKTKEARRNQEKNGVSNHQLADFAIRYKSVFLITVLKDESITH
jgi:hypothetical protein